METKEVRLIEEQRPREIKKVRRAIKKLKKEGIPLNSDNLTLVYMMVLEGMI